MPSLSHALRVKVPLESGRNYYEVARLFRVKAELSAQAGQSLNVLESSSSVRAGSTRDHGRSGAQSSESLTFSTQMKRELGNGVTASLTNSFDAGKLERVAAGVVNGEGRNSIMNYLFGSARASLSMEGVSYSVGYDADLCFISMSGRFPYHASAGPVDFDMNLSAKISIGFTAEFYARLFAAIWRRVPSIRIFAIKVQAFFVNTFGTRMAGGAGRAIGSRVFMGLRLFLRASARLNVWMWAIDLGLASMSLSNWLCERARTQGRRYGQTHTFALTFTLTIFNIAQDFSTVGHVREVQEQGANYASRYRGERRRLVQGYLIAMYGPNAQFGNITAINRNNRDLARVLAHRFAEGLTVYAERDDDYHVSRGINRYFRTNIDLWLRRG